MDTPNLPADSVDALIAEHLPAWLTTAADEHRSALHQALVAQQRAQAELNQRLGKVTPLHTFAQGLLEDALQDLQPPVDVRSAILRKVSEDFEPPLSPALPAQRIYRRREQRLLAAALHNFEANEDFHTLSRVVDATGGAMTYIDIKGDTLTLTPAKFAQVCRELDIGGLYQQHLARHFSPSDDAGLAALNAQLEEVMRSNLEAQVRLAALKGELDERGYRQLLPVFSATKVVPGDSAVLQPFALRLLGKAVVGAVVFEVRRSAAANAPLDGVIAWLPGDPHGPLSQHRSWEVLYQALGKRMRKPGYARFFERFIGEVDRAAFTQVLAQLLAKEGDAAVALDGRHQAIGGSLFGHLRKNQVDKILGDAQVLAVPTGQVDAASRQARQQGYLDASLNLLNLIGLFVPGLGLAMLGVAALQLTHELYEGYEDWTLGDREGALRHVFSVAESVAAAALFSAGAKVVGAAIERVAFVDELVPVEAGPGQLRLCHPDLLGYRVPADQGALGIDHLVVQEGRYRTALDTRRTQWRIEHPERQGAYRPPLLDNGAGGWRHGLESPQHWEGVGYLMRRLGSGLVDVSDVAASVVAETTGFDEACLRRLHIDQAPAPARLLDALERYHLHAQVPALDVATFAPRLAALQPPVGAAGQLLQRDFPGLTARCAEAIAAQASDAQQRVLLSASRVPLALAEQARWALRDSRLDRACAGLRQVAALNDDGYRLALGMTDQLAPWADDVRLEIRQGTASGNLLVAHGATQASDVRTVVKASSGYLAVALDGAARAGANEHDGLFQALLLHMDPVQRLALGVPAATAQQLADRVVARVASDREAAARMLGMAPVGGGIRPPVRLGDGRLGYPLSGRQPGGRRAVYHALRRIYPGFDDDQVHLYVSERIQERVNIWRHVSALQMQLTSLEEQLALWQADALQRPLRASRTRVANQLLAGWREQSVRASAVEHQLRIEGEAIGSLPPLSEPLSFANVTHLRLRGLGLTRLDAAFIGRFSRLLHLDLADNQLTELPEVLTHLPQLRSLDLSGNRIVLGPEGNRRLAGLTNLQRLDLSRNTLVASPQLSSLRRLRQVNLRSAGLSRVPEGLMQQADLEFADLRDNRIASLDPDFYNQPARALERIHLHDNPLDAVSQARQSSFQSAAEGRVATLNRHTPAGEVNREGWLVPLGTALQPSRRQLWNSLASEAESDDFFQLLADLRDTEDYRLQRDEMSRRVWEVIEACTQNSELRERVFDLAMHPTSCADSVALTFSLMEVQSWVHLRTAGLTGQAAEPELLRLGRSLFRLDAVDRAAAEDIEQRIQARDDVDEIEVRLAYRVRLAETLGLPGQPAIMRYPMSAEVTGARLLQVRGQVLTAERTQLAQSVAARAFWQAHLRQTYGARFEALNQPFYLEMEALDARAPTLAEGNYVAEAQRIGLRRDTAQADLFEALTREALARYPL